MEIKLGCDERRAICKAVIKDYERNSRKEGITRVSLYGLEVDVTWVYDERMNGQESVWVDWIEPVVEDVFIILRDCLGEMDDTSYFMNIQRFPGAYQRIKERCASRV